MRKLPRRRGEALNSAQDLGKHFAKIRDHHIHGPGQDPCFVRPLHLDLLGKIALGHVPGKINPLGKSTADGPGEEKIDVARDKNRQRDHEAGPDQPCIANDIRPGQRLNHLKGAMDFADLPILHYQ